MLHRFAQLTALATYVLLLVGGLVHGTGSSLACPDWPLCHGQVFPAMEHGVEYEHSHRLAAAAVSTMTIVLSAWLLWDQRYRSLRPLAIAAPTMVLAQALLGGLTVIFKLPLFITLSHLTLSMCFFSVTLVIALRTRFTDAERAEMAEPPAEVTAAAASTGRLAGLSALGVLGQILLGGFVRHEMAGLACVTFPLCYGHAWPPVSSSSGSERIHMLHRFGACVVAVLVVVTAVAVRRYARATGGSTLRRLAVAAPVLVLLQITLGVLSVTTLLHLPVVETHLAVGAALLGVVVSTWTLLRPARLAERTSQAAAAAPRRAAPA